MDAEELLRPELVDEVFLLRRQIEVLEGGGHAVFATEIDNLTQESIFIPAQKKYINPAE